MTTKQVPLDEAFLGARVAVFTPDGERISNWSPVRRDAPSDWMPLREDCVDPRFRIEGRDGKVLYDAPVFRAPRLVDARDQIALPGYLTFDVG